jgi:hypothetical protein
MNDLDYYRRHSPVTDPGTMRHLFTGLPADPAALATLIGGVLVHRDCAQRFRFTLPERRRDEANTRHVEAILTYLGTLHVPRDAFLVGGRAGRNAGPAAASRTGSAPARRASPPAAP